MIVECLLSITVGAQIEKKAKQGIWNVTTVVIHILMTKAQIVQQRTKTVQYAKKKCKNVSDSNIEKVYSSNSLNYACAVKNDVTMKNSCTSIVYVFSINESNQAKKRPWIDKETDDMIYEGTFMNTSDCSYFKKKMSGYDSDDIMKYSD